METEVKTTETQEPEKAGAEQQVKTEDKKPEGGRGVEKKYTDADVDRIVSEKRAKWEKTQQSKIDEAKKLAEMNEAEKAAYERDKLQKELDELKAEKTLNEITKTARGILQEKGVPATDEILSVLVSPDADKTNAAIDSFAEAFENAVEQTVKDRLKGKSPRGGVSGKALTKDEIMAVKDTAERQQLIMENQELFN